MDAELERWKSAGQYFDYLGFDIFYRVAGSGPTLLLIHGYPFNTWDWAPIWDRLTERFTVIAPDMLGMGFSDKPVRYEYTVHDHADMHEALLADLGIDSAHILAHDLGDSVGQEMLARREFNEQAYGALRIQSITWLNGGMFNEAYVPRLMQKAMSRTPLGDIMSPVQGSRLSRRLFEPTLNEMFGPNTKPSPRQLELFHQILEYNDGKRVMHKVGRFINDRYTHRNRWVRAMRQTSVPMRLIDGPVDPNSGRHMAQRYLEVIPNPDVVMLADDIGHWPQIEAPDAVVEHFLAHIDRVTASD
ncbi:alpha/beta hydrolase [Mycobacterium intermedium]|uniref:Alpha/beta hydrolase n=1 Tax=Mycobacterium intermedium TaxID=28445 RepID=A0A1E3SDV3_MYCIE|nr:alpha/beta hydrolase [Mycobacterium intermedium]MCV6963928.1 alpha/beta hydrolase [Mycobacterium intermedium]ODR00252.1 alpha/beta hydrolase [Mycobacterium intermedium]OPE47555.1 alpha/beta hydrolase [Mycobacterium intermedium]ORA95376.1 alpha/beta hydrolase [Mycobacterium intermedium]